MAKQDASSDLYELKNYFYLGNYQAAINEANSLSQLNDADKIEKDVFVYRCFIAQRSYKFVLSDVKDKAHPSLEAIKLLANYFLKEDGKDSIATLKGWLSDGNYALNETLHLVAAIIYFHEGNYEDAMRVVYNSNTLEGKAMLIQVYLKINRPDLAEKELKAMQKIDEDAVIVQLAGTWVNLALGGETRVNEALLTYQDLVEKYNATPVLLNGLAACNMALKKVGEAERLLLQAIEKDNQNPETLINLIAVYEHQGKVELAQRQINQLRINVPKHPFLASLQHHEDEFDRLVKSFAAEVKG